MEGAQVLSSEPLSSRVWGAIRDLIFPPVCLVCEKDTDGAPVCDDCLALIQPIERGFCQLCGKPLERKRRSYICPECVRKPLALARVRAWARFTHPLDKLVYAFKYARYSRLARFFARRLALVVQSDGLLGSADAIIPIPLHPFKRWRRGYNQSELLAKELSKHTGIRMQDCLERRRVTRTQTRLTPEQRRANVEGAFSMRRGADPLLLADRKLILLDDVITSGSTLDAAARVLLDAGASQVYGLTVGGAWIAR
jgi:ComF family protein